MEQENEHEHAEELLTLADHQAQLAAAVEPLTMQLGQAEALIESGSVTIGILQTGLELAQAERAEAQAKVTALTEQLRLRDEQANNERVEEAFQTYRVAQRLTDAHRVPMKLTLLGDRAAFERLYPRVRPDRKHLLQHVSKDSTGLPHGMTEVPDVGPLCKKIQAENPNMSYDDAFTLALEKRAQLLVGGGF